MFAPLLCLVDCLVLVNTNVTSVFMFGVRRMIGVYVVAVLF